MSYSKWGYSRWYIFPSVEGRVEVWRAGDAPLCWAPGEGYADFLERARASLTHDGAFDEDFAEMRRILERSMPDIQQCFSAWRSGK